MRGFYLMTGEEFKSILTKLGLTQRGFAKFTGVHERTVRRWVSGDCAVPKSISILLGLMEANSVR